MTRKLRDLLPSFLNPFADIFDKSQSVKYEEVKAKVDAQAHGELPDVSSMTPDEIMELPVDTVLEYWRRSLQDEKTQSYYKTYIKAALKSGGIFNTGPGTPAILVKEFALIGFNRAQDLIKDSGSISFPSKKGLVKMHENFCNYLHKITEGKCKYFKRTPDAIYG